MVTRSQINSRRGGSFQSSPLGFPFNPWQEEDWSIREIIKHKKEER